MPNFSGIWTTTQQFQARGQNLWPSVPGTPTIGTASVAGPTSASVAFTASAIKCYVGGVTFAAVSTPGCITSTGSASPLTVSGLTTGVSYTFRVRATNSLGTSAFSSASNSVVPASLAGQQAYTTAGTYTWIAPAGVTSVSVVAVGGGGGGSVGDPCFYGSGGGGGGLAYGNNISVTPGASYSLVVAAPVSGGGFSGCNGNSSWFVSNTFLFAQGGLRATYASGGVGGTSSGTTRSGGGSGGKGGNGFYTAAGGGAAGYSGNGGAGANGAGVSCVGSAGAGGGGGGGGQGGSHGGGGGGVGILGQGANGAGGVAANGGGGGGGSGGCNGINGNAVSGVGGSGGAYGGGGGGLATSGSGGNGAGGAVRIIWPGNTRQFPSTGTGNL